MFRIQLHPQPARTEEGIIDGGVMDTHCLTGALKTAFIQEGPAWGSKPWIIAAKALGSACLNPLVMSAKLVEKLCAEPEDQPNEHL